MTGLLPAILAKDETEFRAKVARVRDLGLTLHIDVMDGVFVDNTTWAPPERMRELLGDIPFEAHLMIERPGRTIADWLAAGASRAFCHIEAMNVADYKAVDALGEARKKFGLAINPATSLRKAITRLRETQNILVMGVMPGRSGQPFDERALDTVRKLRATHPDAFIEVDGGVKPENANTLIIAGADALIVGSALTDALDVSVAAKEFDSALKKI